MLTLPEELARYVKRVEFLEHFVSKAIGLARGAQKLPDVETDRIKAYVVLGYAETEDFVEHSARRLLELVEPTVAVCISELNSTSRAINRKTSERVAPFAQAVAAKNQKYAADIDRMLQRKSLTKSDGAKICSLLQGVLKSKRKEIEKNNGLNGDDVDKLFDSIGFETKARFFELRNDLDILTSRRGEYAHSGQQYGLNVVQHLPDPLDNKSLLIRVRIALADMVTALEREDWA